MKPYVRGGVKNIDRGFISLLLMFSSFSFGNTGDIALPIASAVSYFTAAITVALSLIFALLYWLYRKEAFYIIASIVTYLSLFICAIIFMFMFSFYENKVRLMFLIPVLVGLTSIYFLRYIKRRCSG